MYSEWLQVMLGEIARKREEQDSAERERRERLAESAAGSTNTTRPEPVAQRV